MDYIGKGIAYLQKLEQEKVHQILFNRNYAETIHDYGIQSHVEYDNNIVIHSYQSGKFPYRNCHYWPHYSLLPSICNVSAILQVGNYDSPNVFFEKDFAHKWANNGFKSAFFNRITSRHIGKLRRETNKPNAYQLNNQF